MSAPIALSRFADVVVVPVVAVVCAFLVAGLVVLAIGENPLEVTGLLVRGAVGSREAVGLTLYYATSFGFAGLAVAVAFHAGLFNIGGEGQAILAGIAATLLALAGEGLPALLLLPLAILAAAAGGAVTAAIPGWLQAKRGSHVVITTIMFNFLAATLLVYLLVDVMGRPGSMAPESRNIPEAARLASAHNLLRGFGVDMPTTPLNLSILLLLAAAFGAWVLIWRTRLGFEMRTVGANPDAAAYAGIPTARIVVAAMAISGALAGGVAVNEILGVQHRLILEFTAGAGFVGIAVALMGRAHPAGVLLAALLFGAVTQGGADLSFDKPSITRDMTTVIGGVVILFAGALDGLFRRLVARVWPRPRAAEPTVPPPAPPPAPALPTGGPAPALARAP